MSKLGKLHLLKTSALEAAKNSPCNFKHGCSIYRNGHIISSACNDYSGHAEIRAVEKVYSLLYPKAQSWKEKC